MHRRSFLLLTPALLLAGPALAAKRKPPVAVPGGVARVTLAAGDPAPKATWTAFACWCGARRMNGWRSPAFR